MSTTANIIEASVAQLGQSGCLVSSGLMVRFRPEAPSLPLKTGRPKRNVGTCIAPGCDRQQSRKHLCNKHATAAYQGFLNFDGTPFKCICSECGNEFIKPKGIRKNRLDGLMVCELCKPARKARLIKEKTRRYSKYRVRGQTPAYGSWIGRWSA